MTTFGFLSSTTGIGLFLNDQNDTLSVDVGNYILPTTGDPMKSPLRSTNRLNETDSIQSSPAKHSTGLSNSQMNDEARVLGSVPEPVGVEFDGDREHHCWPERELFKNSRDF